jgi:hypothetical protein
MSRFPDKEGAEFIVFSLVGSVMAKPLVKKFETCPMLARSDWGVGHIQQKGLTHALSIMQSAVGFHGPRVAGWLVFLNGCHRGEDMRLPVGDTKMGSSWLSDLVLTGIGIGSQHAVIKMGISEGLLKPISAERIVKVNNVVISDETVLEDGCLISFGELHIIFRLAEQKHKGYRVSESPKPALMPNQASHREALCGWFVISKGPAMGQDYRLVNGRCRIGSEPNLEVTIVEPNLTGVAVVLSVTTNECKVTEIGDGTRLLINGEEAGVEAMLRESDVVTIGSVEGYIKWFRY